MTAGLVGGDTVFCMLEPKGTFTVRTYSFFVFHNREGLMGESIGALEFFLEETPSGPTLPYHNVSQRARNPGQLPRSRLMSEK